MEEIKIFEDLFDRKIIAVLKALFRDPKKQYYLQELSLESKVPMATCLRILSKLERLEVLDTKKISRVKLYTLRENKKTEFLSSLFKVDLKIMDLFVSEIKSLAGLKSVILHGKEHPDRANVLLIGESLDPGKVKEVCASIKDTYKFTVNSLSLTDEQYQQMSQMGLYPGTKKVLYETG